MKLLSSRISRHPRESGDLYGLLEIPAFAGMTALIFLLVFSCVANAAPSILNVYNWSDYLPAKVITEFEKETGIEVRYTTYDSNETLYAKLKADPKAGYDIVVPSSYFIDRMSKQGMLQKLDKSRLSNFKNLNKAFLNKSYDPENNYSIPYIWGTTGVIVNTQYFPAASVKHWQDLWNERFYDQLVLLDDAREIFSMALLTLGYSANDTDPKHIEAAYLKLKQLLPNVKLFNADAVKNIYIDEDAVVGMGWNGDAFASKKENQHLEFVLPAEGFVIWVDSLAIPKGAAHVDNAYRFINFLLRPDIAAQITMSINYATANAAGMKLLPPQLLKNPVLNPSSAVLARGQFQQDAGAATTLIEKYFELLKISA